MSHDVQIQYKKNELQSIPVKDAQSALRTVGFTEASPLCWVAEKPHTEIYLSVIGESGDSTELDKENPPEEINRIDTHVPLDDYRWGYRIAHYRRTALAQLLNWVAYDVQIDQLVASPVDRADSVLTPEHALEPKAKSSIEMVSSHFEVSIQSRPKGKIVGKDGNDGWCRWLRKTSTGDWLLGLQAERTGGQRAKVLQIRDKSFELIQEIEGVGSMGALSPDGTKAIVSGPVCGGYECQSAFIEISERKMVSRLPFTRPYIWRSDDEFLAMPTPSKYLSNVMTQVSMPFLSTKEFEHAAIQHEHRLFSVNIKNEKFNSVEDDHQPTLFSQGYGFHRSIVIDHSQEIVYFASTNSVGAFNVNTSDVLWQRELGRYDSKDYFQAVREMAISPCGKMLAVGSAAESRSSPNACIVLNTIDGEIVMSTAASHLSTVTAVDWHPSGWPAYGLSDGTVVFIDLTGSRREFKASLKGINSLRFDHDTLIVAGTEKQLRVFPLLPDEIGTISN